MAFWGGRLGRGRLEEGDAEGRRRVVDSVGAEFCELYRETGVGWIGFYFGVVIGLVIGLGF